MARRLESQVADLRFMASQYAHRVEIEQKRVEESRQKAEEALAKLGLFNNAAAAAAGQKGRSKRTNGVGKSGSGKPGQNAAGQVDQLYQRLQKIDIETGLGMP